MEARIISTIEPSSIYSGKMWIKPGNSIFMKLGTVFVPIVSGITDITFQNITILVNGVDRSTDIANLQISDNIKDEIDTCMFTMADPVSRPKVGQEVIVYYKKNLSDPVIIFGGKIINAPQSYLTKDKFIYEIECADYTHELTKKLVVEVYEDELAGDIIKDIIENDVPELGTFHVEDGINIDYISFNYKTALECIKEISDLIGYYWYVDYERNVHFFPIDQNSAPYIINETTSSGDYRDMTVEIDKSQVKNVVFVRGGFELSALYTQEKVADGTQTSFALDYRPYDPITVEVDTGGGYGAKTLGIDNIDTSGYDFVVNVSEKVIKNLDLATLNNGDKVRFKYKYKKPILISSESEASIQTMAELEGGDGRYEYIIVDDTIQTSEQAVARAEAEIDNYASPIVRGRFLTTQYGYRSGQKLQVNLPTRGLASKEYIIQNVNAISLRDGNFEYEVIFATKLDNLTDFLIDLYNTSKKTEERDDEILNILRNPSIETLTITESVTKTALRDVGAAPFVWSNDSGTTPNAGQWNLCEWA